MCTLKSIRRAEASRAIVVELESEPAGTVGPRQGATESNSASGM
jgi:hypothetical protein